MGRSATALEEDLHRTCRDCERATGDALPFHAPPVSTLSWNCPVHGRCARIENATGASLTIRSGPAPSPTVVAWLDTIALQGRGRPGNLVNPLDWSLLRWAGTQPIAVDAYTAALFAAYGVCPTAMEYFLRHGVVNVVTAQDWLYTALVLDDSGTGTGAWISAGFTDPARVRPWLLAGVEDPQVAARFTSVVEHRFASIAQVPLTREWGSLHYVVAPDFARLGYEAGQSPAAVAALGRALARAGHGGYNDPRDRDRWSLPGSRRYESPWSAGERLARCRLMGTFEGLDWADVADCFDAGMSPGQAHGHLRRGEDMEPVRLLAALAR